MKKIFIYYSIFFTSFSLSIAQNKVFVNQKIASGGDGKTWATAFNSLQIALQDTLAKSEIWIAEGSYFPTDATDRMKSFVIPNGYKIYGGFKGNETTLQQRDWEKNKTILSGDIGEKNDNEDNSYCVVELNDVDSTTVLDGLIISNGNANNKDINVWSNQKSKAGGGLRIISKNKNCKPQLLNCNFNNNVAQGSGGGAYVNFEGTNIIQPLFYNCGFENNTGGYGAGISIKARLEKDTAFFSECFFSANQSNTLGTAINVDDITGARFVIENCIFKQNIENFACFHVAVLNCPFLMEGCIFEENVGGLFSFENNDYDLNIQNCEFKRNTGNASMLNIANAGFFTQKKSKFLIENCLFSENIYPYWTISVDGISDEVILNRLTIQDKAAISCYNQKKLFILNSMLVRPKISMLTDSFRMINNTMIAAGANRNSIGFGAKKEGVVKNNIFYKFNKEAIFELYIGTKVYFSHLLSNFLNANDSLSKYFETGEGFNVEDFVIIDKSTCYLKEPLFINAQNADFRLSPCSPAINAGTFNFFNIKDLLIKDLDGNKRIVGDSIDIGAYEYQNDNNLMFSVKIIDPSGINNNGSVTLENVSGGTSPYTYAWSNGATTLKIENLTAAFYTVTVTDKNGCATIRKFKVGNPIATNDVFLSDATIYPNPVEDKLYIQQIDNELDNVKIDIYNLQGALLLSSDYSKEGLNVSFLPKGIYFLQCSNGAQSRAMKMLKL